MPEANKKRTKQAYDKWNDIKYSMKLPFLSNSAARYTKNDLKHVPQFYLCRPVKHASWNGPHIF